MARKITEQAIDCFLQGKTFHLNNTSITRDETTTRFLLWGNCIAYYFNTEKEIYFSLCGYNTATTRERLRGLGLNIRTKNGKIFWGNHEIDSRKYHNSNIKAF